MRTIRDSFDPRRHLPRLSPEFYQGFAAVHWVMSIQDRRSGWLTPAFHQGFREILLHSLARHQCCCPIYCLMPDHLHFMIVGWHPTANQLQWSRFMKAHLNELLASAAEAGGFVLQKQSYDHVMRRDEIDESDFENALRYIAQNPVEAGLISEALAYPYTGVMLPGFPSLSFWHERYWRIFWEQTCKRISAGGTSWNAAP